jgi:hypothetical protein
MSFWNQGWKFLGYVVTKRGIEASPEQIKAIINIKSPTNIKMFKDSLGGLQH